MGSGKCQEAATRRLPASPASCLGGEYAARNFTQVPGGSFIERRAREGDAPHAGSNLGIVLVKRDETNPTTGCGGEQDFFGNELPKRRQSSAYHSRQESIQ